MDGKTKALVAHIFWVGWIIALIVNSNDREELASFYIRQTLGIWLFSVVISLIPPLIAIGWVVTLVFWIISLLGAINGEMKEIPWIGKYFQDWFRAL